MKLIYFVFTLFCFSISSLQAEDRFLVACPNPTTNPVSCHSTECTASLHIELPNQKNIPLVAPKTSKAPPLQEKLITFTQSSASMNGGGLRCIVMRSDKISLEFEWSWTEIYAEVKKLAPNSHPSSTCGATAMGMSCPLN